MHAIALVIVCIASYRALFVQVQKKRRLGNLEEKPSPQKIRCRKYDIHGKRGQMVAEAANLSDSSSCEDIV